uniref:DNA damage inducible transcript 3 n=1 Tax=Corvus moneduloides TaxID=1196302 RepID=A0A8C3DF77_CORMO
MAAEGLWGPGGPPGWELEGWYQDLQEVLAAEPPGTAPTWGAEQVSAGLGGPGGRGAGSPIHHRSWSPLSLQLDPGPGGCGLDAALAEELLELLGPEGAAPAEAPGTAPGGSSSALPGPAEEEEEEAARGARRKRRGGPGAPRDGERRVRELTAHNERLRAEIQRLSAEVQRTRAALIDRIVNLRRV